MRALRSPGSGIWFRPSCVAELFEYLGGSAVRLVRQTPQFAEVVLFDGERERL
ncbi:hypothetical protein ACFY1U_44105 [Streptomyces sp. NPDC001351]|uniref:hypothetical protein n=1 Tax=Streptomyces sp. NPDC001351 TaxID=3364564 RepID=UPI00368E7F41